MIYSIKKYTEEIVLTHSRYDCNLGCPVEATLKVIGGKWKGIVLYHLMSETIRFNQLRRLMPEITQRMLTKQLRELEADKLVSRKVYAEVPPKVEYSLTKYGHTLVPVIHALQKWGINHLERKHNQA
jgi:DNA-binding HxlR family transcriptional regulator